MNERIKLLAEQAESSRLEYNSATMMTERIQEFDKRKFAELIVRDCALTAGIMEYECRAGIGAQLLDNFGVKND